MRAFQQPQGLPAGVPLHAGLPRPSHKREVQHQQTHAYDEVMREDDENDVLSACLQPQRDAG